MTMLLTGVSWSSQQMIHWHSFIHPFLEVPSAMACTSTVQQKVCSKFLSYFIFSLLFQNSFILLISLTKKKIVQISGQFIHWWKTPKLHHLINQKQQTDTAILIIVNLTNCCIQSESIARKKNLFLNFKEGKGHNDAQNRILPHKRSSSSPSHSPNSFFPLHPKDLEDSHYGTSFQHQSLQIVCTLHAIKQHNQRECPAYVRLSKHPL